MHTRDRTLEMRSRESWNQMGVGRTSDLRLKTDILMDTFEGAVLADVWLSDHKGEGQNLGSVKDHCNNLGKIIIIISSSSSSSRFGTWWKQLKW